MSTLKTINLQHPTATNTNIVLDNNGRVGIGTSSPSNLLEIAGNSSNIYLRSNDSGDATLRYMGASSERATVRATTANNLLIETAGIERFRIDSSGRITVPYQPRVQAYKTNGSGWANYYNGGSGAAFVFNNVPVNVGNHYNSSTGIFTAPITGYYRVDTQILIGYGSGANYFRLFKNGVAWADGHYNNFYSTSVHISCGMSWIVSCSVNDTLQIWIYGGNSTTVYDQGWNSLNIELVG